MHCKSTTCPGEQIELPRSAPALAIRPVSISHGSLPDPDRRRPILCTLREPYPAHPTRAMPEPTAWRDPPGRAPRRASPPKPRGRTSRAELPATGPAHTRRECIARGQYPPSLRHYGPGQGGRSKDATDKASCGRWSYGRSRAQLYNAIRPHGSLGYRPPAPEAIVMPSWPPGSATLRQPTSLAGKPAMHQHSN